MDFKVRVQWARRGAALDSAVIGLGLVVGGETPTVGKRIQTGSNNIPNVPLQSNEGKSVCFFDDLVTDRIVTLNVMYTDCGDSCPLITDNFCHAQDLLGNRVQGAKNERRG